MIRALALLALLVVLVLGARSFVPEGTEALGSGRILAFGFLLLVAIQSGHVMQSLGLPKLTGFLLAGAVFGPGVLGVLTPHMLADLTLVKKVSVGLIALLAGCELNLKTLRPKLRSVSALTFFSFLFPFLLSFVLLFFISPYVPGLSGLAPDARLVVSTACAVVLSATSPAVVVAILSELRAAGPLSSLVLSVVVLTDLLITVFFTLAMILVQTSFPNIGGTTGISGLLVHIFGSLGIGALLGGVFSLYLQRVKDWGGLFIFAVLFVVAEAGSVLHLDPLLVGLSAGLFLENISSVGGHAVIKKIEPATMPSFAIFFGVAGADLKLHALLDVALFAPAAALVRALGMWLGAWTGRKVGKVELMLGKRVFWGLLPQAGVAIALADIIRGTSPEWGPQVATFLFGVIVLNELTGPAFFRSALLRAGEAGQQKEDSAIAHAAHVAPEEPHESKDTYGQSVMG